MRRAPADQPVRERAATAIDTNIFLDAGAGCGKTQALTDRYLQLLEAGLQVREIVAVTFTNKAAREMKARLRERCEKKAKEAQTPEQATAWRRRGRELESAPISTIHSFCINLLKRYAVRAGLDPQFALMNEIEQRLILAQATRASLLKRLDAEETTTALLVSELGLPESAAIIARVINSRDELAEPLAHPPSPQQLLAEWQRRHGEFTAQRLRLLVQGPVWRAAVKTLLQTPADEPGHPMDEQRLTVLECASEVACCDLPLEQRLEALRRMLSVGRTSGAKGGWSEADRRKLVTDAMGCLKNAGGAIGKLLPELLQPWDECEDCATGGAELTAAAYQEAHHAFVAFEEAKDASSLLDFEDVQVLARELLRDNPQVRRDCHERYRHMLVDEFQDTNALQKELLWLAAGAEPRQPCAPGRLFVVGDAKQSIYRFRDADVTVFDETRKEFGEQPGHEASRLEVTFRAHPQVATLHNDLFQSTALMGPDRPERSPYEAFYSRLSPHRQSPEGPAAATLLLVRNEDPDNGDAESLRSLEALALAEWLKDAIGTMTVFDKDGDGEKARPAELKDVALLFRSTTNLRLYERALRLHGLTYYTSAGRGFFTRQEILDLMNLLRGLENWRDEISLAGALRSPLFGLSDETLFWLKQDREELHEGLRQAAEGTLPSGAFIGETERPLVAFAWEQINVLREIKNRLPISTLISEIIDRTGYTAAVAGLFGGEQMISNLRRLVDIARGFETGSGRGGNYSLRDFVDYLQGLTVSEERMGQAPVEEESADCIKLMTIHAAKGLEWPIVIVPDIGAGNGSREAAGWRYHRHLGVIAARRDGDARQWPVPARVIDDLNAAEDEAERRRLLYVAATRCRDHLVMSSALDLRRSGQSWLEWLTEATELDLDSGSLRMDGISVLVRTSGDLKEPVGDPNASKPQVTLPPADVIRRRVQPVALDLTALRRFTVTGLSAYLKCPACYDLRTLQGLPEQQVRVAMPEAGQQLSALDRGSLVHRALEIVGSQGADAAGDAVRLALKVRRLDPREHDRMMSMLTWYLTSELYLKQVKTATRLRSEMPLAFELEGALIEGKLDAVAEHEGGNVLEVIDYKTGYEDAEAPEEHVFQLGLYCAGLELLGKHVRDASIVYLDAQRVDPLTRAHFASARERALGAIAGIRAGQFPAEQKAECDACRLGWVCRR